MFLLDSGQKGTSLPYNKEVKNMQVTWGNPEEFKVTEEVFSQVRVGTVVFHVSVLDYRVTKTFVTEKSSYKGNRKVHLDDGFLGKFYLDLDGALQDLRDRVSSKIEKLQDELGALNVTLLRLTSDKSTVPLSESVVNDRTHGRKVRSFFATLDEGDESKNVPYGVEDIPPPEWDVGDSVFVVIPPGVQREFKFDDMGYPVPDPNKEKFTIQRGRVTEVKVHFRRDGSHDVFYDVRGSYSHRDQIFNTDAEAQEYVQGEVQKRVDSVKRSAEGVLG